MNYQLFDLDITTTGDPITFNCSHKVGDGLLVEGENIMFKPGTKQFSHYALASLTPYIAAKQRATQESDFMYFETEIACPDPKCGALFNFTRKTRKSYVYKPIDRQSLKLDYPYSTSIFAVALNTQIFLVYNTNTLYLALVTET